ncbi:hypothetical protein CGCSCA4_v010189 [Colletotrichum siamense]|uniref:NACHT domain-containing protein n=1 Tax=Colletotrichum siamense TaxID=690259 RepID=A0A9P5ENE6_COLSI|nr:hypothetical protein CGCSCA4_v010189 [Colletotrichum siamense]KAF4855404.1 hypothetical protein CGCSCA2_v009130 [Colletotrichum siamense]
MDPMSAFGLAVNILTVIDLSVKVISTTSEIRSRGESITTSDRFAMAQHFESQCEKLIGSFKPTPEPSGGSTHAAILDDDDVALRALAEEATVIARGIQQGLVRRQKGRPLVKTLRDAVLSIWGEREMKEKTERLESMRNQIQFVLMISIKTSCDVASLRGDQTWHKLDNATQQVIGTLLSDNDAIRSDMERHIEVLNQEVVSHFDQASRLASRRHDELLAAIAQRSGLDKTALLEDPAIITDRILNSLWFPRINDRYEDILPAHEKTFEWVFSRDTHFRFSSTFVEWIENGTGVYWMSGKAASGKSTLIKAMADDPRTEMLLRTWAHGQPLVTAKYLFWDQSPDVLQKSLDGLFRGILHDIIRQETSFAPLLFPDQFKEENGWSGPFPTSNELKRAFERLAFLKSSPTQVALLIDGLDEYSAPQGAQHELTETLKRAACSKHMKIVASSRPETVFEKAFSDCDKLYLQDMTSRDRILFVSDKLYEHPRTSYLVDDSGGKTAIDYLIQSAVERSEGVFLWLRLVVEALVRELDVCDCIGDLQSVLVHFPRGLEKLFLHMMQRMLRENERRGLGCLWVMHQSLGLPYKQSPYQFERQGNSGGTDYNYSFRLTASCMDGAQMPLDMVLKTELGPLSPVALEDSVAKVEKRLRSWCAGLLELKPTSDFTLDGESKEPEISFVHRSVSEFLKLPSDTSGLAEELVETSFDVDFMLMKGLLVNLKREATSWDFHDTGKIWVFVELIMRLAQFADDDKRRQTHALLSELDRSMMSLVDLRQKSPSLGLQGMCRGHSGANHWAGYFPWAPRNYPTSFRTPCNCIQRSLGFLSIAVENGLAEFVLEALDNPEIKSAVKAAMGTPLLNSACRPPPFSITIPGTIRPAIIHKLLDFGVDPNQECQDGVGNKTTPWKSMLRTVNDLEITTVEGARQFAELLTAMIKHGADQRVRIRTKMITKRKNACFGVSTDDLHAAPPNTSRKKWEACFESHRPSSALSAPQIGAPIKSGEETSYAPGSVGSLSSVPSEDSHHLRQWKANFLDVQGIVSQSFINKPSLRKESDDAVLPGKFVPFEEIGSTWEIRDEQWGLKYGATYPHNFHPPKLTSSGKASIEKMGMALLKLLHEKEATQHADSKAAQGASVDTGNSETVQSVSVQNAGLEAIQSASVQDAEPEAIQSVSVKDAEPEAVQSVSTRIPKLGKLHKVKTELLARFRRNRK